MSAKARAAIYALAVTIGGVALVYGWLTSDEVEVWLKVVDSILGLVLVAAPALALKNLTPDAPKE
jgi:hypothetical protein